MLWEHLRGDTDADTTDTCHVFPFGPAQSDPIDQSFSWRLLSFTSASPRYGGLSCVIAKFWHGNCAASQTKSHIFMNLSLSYNHATN